MNNRVFNFSAGPSMLPLPVLEKAASELICYGESGMSVMEMSHRSPDYEAIINDAEAMLRRLMNIPDNYKVLFLQGGASTQFSAVPMNLINRTGKADYGSKAYADSKEGKSAVGMALSQLQENQQQPENKPEGDQGGDNNGGDDKGGGDSKPENGNTPPAE